MVGGQVDDDIGVWVGLEECVDIESVVQGVGFNPQYDVFTVWLGPHEFFNY